MDTFFICYVEGSDGGRHYKHESLESAMTEAERLARLNQGKDVYVLECMGYCWAERAPVFWSIDFSEHPKVSRR